MSRPAATLNPLYANASLRPVASSRAAARIVRNIMFQAHATYKKGGGTLWGDNPTDTSAITWGANVDGGQWFEATATGGGDEQVYVTFTNACYVGTTFILSFTVDSKSGTHGAGGNARISGPTFTGTTLGADLAVGRHALVVRAGSSANTTFRLGVGVNAANGATATMRFSNVMLEQIPAGARDYPYEYVTPGDQRAYNFSHTNTMSGTLVGVPTLGDPYPIPTNSSVLIIGDSLSTQYPNNGLGKTLKDALAGKPIAVNTRGVSGNTLDQITAQIAPAIAETTEVGSAPYTLCISEGGTNDVGSNKTLEQMQASRIAMNAAILAAGMYPVMLTTPPRNSATGGQQTVIDGYNAWLKTLGYPVYDLYADADDGNGDYKTLWASPDGIHPGYAGYSGYYLMGQRLRDLIMLIGDR